MIVVACQGRLGTERPKPVDLSRVEVTGPFWSKRMAVNREQTIPAIYRQLQETGRLDAFSPAPHAGARQVPHFLWDSDVAKWIEAASYTLVTHPDPQRQALVDQVCQQVASAQQSDGYLNTFITALGAEKRWKNLGMWHELYNAGHFIEAAVAHLAATGRPAFFNAIRRYADLIQETFGPGKYPGYPGHPEIELALVRLYRATGDRRYLELAVTFLDRRGQRPSIFERELAGLSDEDAVLNRQYLMRNGKVDTTYCQDHLPVREQREAAGHSVRAMYLYAAMVDVAVETGDQSLLEAADRLWESVTQRKMYVTGGLGAARAYEGFTGDYDLPNDAYAETCAAIGLIFWSHRMFHAHPDGRYIDTLERALYNGALSGVSLDGCRFFYENPLVSTGDHQRQPWFEVACCPPNIARLIASLGGYVYSEGPAEAYVHLYVGGSAWLNLSGGTVRLEQETDYPWGGIVQIRVEPSRTQLFTLWLRIPGWCRSWEVQLNGATVEAPVVERGYVGLTRSWSSGDTVVLKVAMPVERVYAHPAIQADSGMVALQRGPVVYCVEEVDNPFPLHQVILPAQAPLVASFDRNLLGGVVRIDGEAWVEDEAGWGEQLYRFARPERRRVRITAVPYFAWANRAPGEMRVWLRSEP